MREDDKIEFFDLYALNGRAFNDGMKRKLLVHVIDGL